MAGMTRRARRAARAHGAVRRRAGLRRRARARRDRDRAARLRRPRRVPHHRPDRRQAGRPARSRGSGTTTASVLTSARSGGRSATACSSRRSRPRSSCRRAMAAFPLSRYAFRGREAIYTFFTFGLLFPSRSRRCRSTSCCASSACSIAARRRAPEAAFGLPITIVILRPFMRAVPVELEDAAAIDGCGGSASSGASCCRCRGPR